jgi:hypothetical protein
MMLLEDQGYANLQFGKQFLIGPTGFNHEILTKWNSTRLGHSLELHYHPAAGLTTAQSDSVRLHGLGMFLEPEHPERNDTQILNGLTASASSFEQLESALSSLGGRWVLAATIRGHSRLYHDAGGLKSIFVSYGGASTFYVASQPSLLCALDLSLRNEELVRLFETQQNSGSWPVNVTPIRRQSKFCPGLPTVR